MMRQKWSKMLKKTSDRCEKKRILSESQFLRSVKTTKQSFNEWCDMVLLQQLLWSDCELLLLCKQASFKIWESILMSWRDLLKSEWSCSQIFKKQQQKHRLNQLILFRQQRQCFSSVLHKKPSWKIWWCLVTYRAAMRTSWKACDLCSAKYLQRENWRDKTCFNWSIFDSTHWKQCLTKQAKAWRHFVKKWKTDRSALTWWSKRWSMQHLHDDCFSEWWTRNRLHSAVLFQLWKTMSALRLQHCDDSLTDKWLNDDCLTSWSIEWTHWCHILKNSQHGEKRTPKQQRTCFLLLLQYLDWHLLSVLCDWSFLRLWHDSLRSFDDLHSWKVHSLQSGDPSQYWLHWSACLHIRYTRIEMKSKRRQFTFENLWRKHSMICMFDWQIEVKTSRRTSLIFETESLHSSDKPEKTFKTFSTTQSIWLCSSYLLHVKRYRVHFRTWSGELLELQKVFWTVQSESLNLLWIVLFLDWTTWSLLQTPCREFQSKQLHQLRSDVLQSDESRVNDSSDQLDEWYVDPLELIKCRQCFQRVNLFWIAHNNEVLQISLNDEAEAIRK